MGAVMARWHPRCGVGGAGSGGAVEIDGDTAGVGRCGGENEADSRAHLAERRARGGQLGRREPKGKTYFRKYATDARAS
jgi:hypothetical protein